VARISPVQKISEAETEKIMKAQEELSQENDEQSAEDKDAEEIEIILYKDSDSVGESEEYVIIPNEELEKEADDVETFELVPVADNDGDLVLDYQEPMVPIIKSVSSENTSNVKTFFPKKAPETIVSGPTTESVIIIESPKVPETPVQETVKEEEPEAQKVVMEAPKKKEPKKSPVKRAVVKEAPKKSPPKRAAKKPRVELPKAEDPKESVLFLPDEIFKKKLEELLVAIVEDDILQKLDFKKRPIEDVLVSVLEECDRTPIKKENASFKGDEMTRMRENAKILFTLCLEPEQLAVLINNHTVDELVHIILGFSKDN
jgi:hypothetical protein